MPQKQDELATTDESELDLDEDALQSVPPSAPQLDGRPVAPVALPRPATTPSSPRFPAMKPVAPAAAPRTRDARPPPPPPPAKRSSSSQLAPAPEIPQDEPAGLWPSARTLMPTPREEGPSPWPAQSERLAREIEARAVQQPMRAALLLAALARVQKDVMNDAAGASDALERASSLAPDARLVASAKRWLAEAREDAAATLEATRGELHHVGEGRERTALLWQVAAIEEHVVNDASSAMKTMRELLELDPNDLGALEALGALHLHLRPRILRTGPQDASALTGPAAANDEAVFGGAVEALERIAQGTDDAVIRSALQGAAGALRDRYLPDVDAALASLRRALEADPANTGAQATIEAILLRRRAWDEYARCLMSHAGGTAEAIAARELYERAGDIFAECISDLPHAAHCFDRAAALAETDPGPVEKLVRVLEAAGLWEETVDAYQRLLARVREPVQRAWTLVRLGGLYENRLQRPDDALATYRKAVDAHPTFAPAVQALLRMARERGLPLAFELERREADRIVDPNVRAVRYAALAEIIEAGKTTRFSEEAAALYERTLALDPANSAAFEALDRAYRSSGQWPQLIALYENAIAAATEPDSTTHPRRLRSLRLHLADLLHARAREPARAALLRREALKGPDDRYDVLVSLGRALADAEQWAELALVLEEQARLLEGPDAIAALYRAAATLEARVKDTKRALAMYETVLEKAPRHEAAARAISRIHENEGRWEKVIAAERKLLDLATRPEDILEGLIRIAQIAEEQLGRGEEAIGAYLEALYCAPTHAPVVAALGRLLRTSGDIRRLATVLERYADATPDRHRKVRARIRAATVLELCLDDGEAAAASYTRALSEVDPTAEHGEADRHAALWGLLRLQEARGEWQNVEATLMRILEATTERPARKRVLVRLARNRELRFNDVPRASRLYEQAVASGADPGEMEIARAAGKRDTIESSIAAMSVDRVRVARLEGKREAVATTLAAMAACTSDVRLENGLLRVLALANEYSGTGPRGRSKAAALYERLVSRDAEDPQALDGVIRCIPALAALPSPSPSGTYPAHQPTSGSQAPGPAHAADPTAQRRGDASSAAEPTPRRRGDPVSRSNIPAAQPASRSNLPAAPKTGAPGVAPEVRLSRALVARARATRDLPLRAWLAFTAGVLDENGGRDEAAEAAYTFALVAEPELVPALDAARRLRARIQDWPAVASLAERAARASVDRENVAEAWLEAAEVYEKRLGDSTRALASYRALLAVQPAHTVALERALKLLETSVDFSGAASILLAHIDALPHDPAAQARWLTRRANILSSSLGDTAGAIVDLKRAIKLTDGAESPSDSPETLRMLQSLALLEERAHDWQEALQLHERIAQMPSDAARRRARLAQARILAEELRDDAKAREILEALVAERTEDRDAAFRLAEVSARSGHHERALELYQSLSESPQVSPPERVRALIALADLQIARPGTKTAGEAAIGRAFDLAIADATMIPPLQERFTKGDPRAFIVHADAAILRARPTTPGVLPLRTAMARVLREQVGDPEAANRQLTLAIQAFPDSMATRLSLATALIGRKDEEALAELRRAVAADPIAPGPYEALLALARTTGRAEAAVLLASAAALLGSNSSEVEATLHKPRPLQPVADSLVAQEAMARLVGPTHARFVRTLLPILDPFLPKLFPGGESMLETRARLSDSEPLSADTRAIAAALGVAAPPVLRGVGSEVVLLLTDPRAIVLGRELLGDSARALAEFYIACTVARIAAHGSIYAAPRQHVSGIIEAAALPETDSSREFKKRLGKVLPRKTKKDLERLVEGVVPDVHAELAAWEVEESRRALYSAIVLCRDMRAVAQVVASDALSVQRVEARRQAFSSNARLREILEFVASAACWDAIHRVHPRGG